MVGSTDEEGVAVGLSPGGGSRARVSARPRPIVDYDAHSELIVELLGKRAREGVGASARRKGHYQRDGPLRPGLGRGRCGDECRGGQGEDMQNGPFQVVPPRGSALALQYWSGGYSMLPRSCAVAILGPKALAIPDESAGSLMGLSVLELLSIELGALPANPAGVRFDRAEAAVVAEMDGWYAGETHSLFGLAKKLQQDAVLPLRGRRNVTVHVALLVVPLRTRLAMITPSGRTS